MSMSFWSPKERSCLEGCKGYNNSKDHWDEFETWQISLSKHKAHLKALYLSVRVGKGDGEKEKRIYVKNATNAYGLYFGSDR